MLQLPYHGDLGKKKKTNPSTVSCQKSLLRLQNKRVYALNQYVYGTIVKLLRLDLIADFLMGKA